MSLDLLDSSLCLHWPALQPVKHCNKTHKIIIWINPLLGKCSYLITWEKLRKLIYTLIHNDFMHQKMMLTIWNFRAILWGKTELKIADGKRGEHFSPHQFFEKKKSKTKIYKIRFIPQKYNFNLNSIQYQWVPGKELRQDNIIAVQPIIRDYFDINFLDKLRCVLFMFSIQCIQMESSS